MSITFKMFSTSNPTSFFVTSLLTLLISQSYVLGQGCTGPAAKYPATFAGGLSAKVLINGLKNPRSLKFDTLGNLLVVEQGGAGVRQIKLTDEGTNVCVASSKQIISDNTVSFEFICFNCCLVIFRRAYVTPNKMF
jgi:hypothetical protein